MASLALYLRAMCGMVVRRSVRTRILEVGRRLFRVDSLEQEFRDCVWFIVTIWLYKLLPDLSDKEEGKNDVADLGLVRCIYQG